MLNKILLISFFYIIFYVNSYAQNKLIVESNSKLINTECTYSEIQKKIADLNLNSWVLANAGNTKEGLRAIADIKIERIDLDSFYLNCKLNLLEEIKLTMDEYEKFKTKLKK